MSDNKILKRANELFEEIRTIRRDVHMHPELGYHENRTSALIKAKLREYGVDNIEQPTPTSVVATIIGRKGEGKTIALRADIDALPINEETRLEFASENDGVMHACGHDFHVSMMLGNADDVDAIVGLHVLPDEDPEEYGKVCFRSGPMTTSADLVQVTVTGLGGHSSQPHLLHDPVLAASQMIVLLQQIQARYTDANETAILPITYIRGDSAINVVPERVEFGGAARTYNNEVRKVIEDQVYKIGRGVAEMSGCTVDVNYVKGYAPVINDKELTALSRAATADVIGEDRVIDLERPMNFSEDFSAYSDVSGKPGTFMILKAGNAGHYAPLHNPASTLNEGTIPYGMAVMIATAIRYLNGDCSA